MNKINKVSFKLIALSLCPFFFVACENDPAISFSKDVKPVLDKNCVQCHQTGGQGQVASGFSMDSYAALMKGTNYGPMVVAGDAEGSNLLVLMEGRADPSISMPHGTQKPVSKENVYKIRQWIEQGAKDN